MSFGVYKNYQSIQKRIAIACEKKSRSLADVTIIAVSKLQPDEVVKEGVESGLYHLGENYVQELIKKSSENWAKNVTWHLIGPLQRNKVKSIIGLADIIHTVDRVSLIQEIDKQAKLKKTIQKCLIQVNISEEESKSGVLVDELPELLKLSSSLENVEILGLMTMPPLVNNPEINRPFFRALNYLMQKMNQEINLNMNVLSMGTSHDFEVAVEEGATHVRIGSLIFGERNLT